jgi:hypothetical protein
MDIQGRRIKTRGGRGRAGRRAAIYRLGASQIAGAPLGNFGAVAGRERAYDFLVVAIDAPRVCCSYLYSVSSMPPTTQMRWRFPSDVIAADVELDQRQALCRPDKKVKRPPPPLPQPPRLQVNRHPMGIACVLQ